MMFRFLYPSVEQVRDYEQGRLVRSGVRWDEERPLLYNGSVIVIMLGGGLIVALLLAKAPIPDRAGFVFGIALVLSLAGAIGFSFRFKKRALIFTDEGKLLTPHGFPGYPFRKTIDGYHTNISSIDMRLNEMDSDVKNKLYVVNVYSFDGHILRLTSANYHHDYAYRIQTELNNALWALR